MADALSYHLSVICTRQCNASTSTSYENGSLPLRLCVLDIAR